MNWGDKYLIILVWLLDVFLYVLCDSDSDIYVLMREQNIVMRNFAAAFDYLLITMLPNVNTSNKP